MSIGENIKRLRKQNKIEQADLGKRLGISGKTISSWECGRTEPRAAMIEKMAEIFGCDQSDIISGTGKYSMLYDSRRDERLHLIVDCFEKMTDAQKNQVVDYARFLLRGGENEY